MRYPLMLLKFVGKGVANAVGGGIAGDLLFEVIPEVAADVQVRHNDMIVATEHATLGRLEVTGVPVKLRGTPGSVRRSPPVHGQHTVELLRDRPRREEMGAAARERCRGTFAIDAVAPRYLALYEEVSS